MSEVKIEILDTNVVTRSGKNERGDWTMHEQKGFMHVPGQQYPHQITLSLPKDRAGTPWPVGMYVLDLAASLYVGSYGKLQLGTLFLAPVPASDARPTPLKTGTNG